MKYSGATDIGLKRKENQDSFKIVEYSNNLLLASICDGIGGNKGGKQASQIAIKAFSDRVSSFIKANFDMERQLLKATDVEISHILREAIEYANKMIIAVAQAHPEYSDMGTTIVSTLIYRDKIFIANAGDSRLYYQTPQKLLRGTKDHKLVEYYMEKYHLTREKATQEASKRAPTNCLIKALGIDEFVNPDVELIINNSPTKVDKILLCSDGLYNFISQRTLSTKIRNQIIKSNDDANDLVNNLIDISIKNGGFDNITAIIINL